MDISWCLAVQNDFGWFFAVITLPIGRASGPALVKGCRPGEKLKIDHSAELSVGREFLIHHDFLVSIFRCFRVRGSEVHFVSGESDADILQSRIQGVKASANFNCLILFNRDLSCLLFTG